eukprot:CAMPEP_0197438704 /NCGR_PEP_ID=MMETSP1175-20131217/5617_1 /TAXON_ID=1003142 /ORGANISM="Triceratium dubium, Strain CCMP147" /LENGTH=854 /DNA_ID=CAMNT_0042968483 /DNA_START=520 /DNA_END=3084 /DNA_ORIENTATION=+
MREAKWRSYPASAGSENIDQRLAEEGNMEHQKHNRRQLHKAERKQSFEEKKRQKFVSFFDEVDSLMEEKYGHKSPSAEPSLLDILGEPSLLRTNPAVSPVTSDLCDRPNVAVDSRTPSSLTDVPSSVGSSRKSIFDFDVIPAAIPAADNKNAYEKNSYEQYYLFLQDAIAQMEKRKGLDKEVIEWLTKDERVVHSDLTILDDVIRDGGAISAKNSATGESSETVALRDQLKDQQEKFLESVTLTPGQLTQARTALKIIADLCAKRARAAPVEIAWEKIKEAGIIPSKGAMDTFLYVVSTGGLGLVSSISVPLDNYLLSQNAFPDQRSGSILDALKPLDGKLDSGSDEHSCDGSKSRDMKEEVSVFRDILYEPTERSISVRINSLVAKGNPKAAELLLEAFKSSGGEAVRLRTFMPVLKYYCEQGNVTRALSLFKQMRTIPTVYLEPETYVLMISTVAENGFFRIDADPIGGETGYKAAAGPDLFDELVSEMADDVLEITSASARRIYNALAVGFKGDKMAKHLKEIHSLSGVPSRNEAADDKELVACRVTVDANTAVCPRTGATLRLILIAEKQREQMHESLLQLSKTSIEELNRSQRGRSGSDSEFAARELTRFSRWLDERTGPPFTAVVDGANVAYYMQNFDQGRFNYHQIQFVVDALLSMKENPLVIVPYKYTTPSFLVHAGMGRGIQRLGEKEKAILEELTRQGRLWSVPPRCLDDFYWMLASVSDQTASRNGAVLDVLPNDDEGRWPGTRPMLISNDQMRDHKLELMEPRLYRRWYSCHLVNYNFTAFVDDECVDREIGFSTPDFFSREIQGNPSPAKSGGAGEGTAWHFPVGDWDLNDRFCVRIPRET